MKLTFLGGTGTLTGSKYLVTEGNVRVLVDCGLFQGYKQLRLRNWGAPPVAPASLSAVVLTHAHLDDTGYLPLLVKQGFAGKIYCSEATYDADVSQREVVLVCSLRASAMLVAEADRVRRNGLSPMARLVAWGVVAVEPGLFSIAPVPAVRQALARAEWKLTDVERVEINEAFAAVAIACQCELGIAEDIANVEGGALPTATRSERPARC